MQSTHTKKKSQFAVMTTKKMESLWLRKSQFSNLQLNINSSNLFWVKKHKRNDWACIVMMRITFHSVVSDQHQLQRNGFSFRTIKIMWKIFVRSNHETHSRIYQVPWLKWKRDAFIICFHCKMYKEWWEEKKNGCHFRSTLK